MGSSDSSDRRLRLALRLARRAGSGAWLTLRGFLEDRGPDRAAALAYVTLLSLVPLMAALAALYRSFFSTHIEKIVEIFTVILPYSTTAVERTLGEFVRRATTLGGVGLLVFIAIAFRLFQLIETTLNEVWGTPTRRPISIRLFSFTMILFWGPVVMGVGSTLTFWLERQPWAPSSAILITLGRILIPFVALTMVYWLAPHTGVHLGAAAVGGLTAMVGLQLLRAGFLAYIHYFPNVNFIFGSLALAVLFLVSLFAFWILVILGAEASYVAQNLGVLMRADEPGRPQLDPMTSALSVLAACYELRGRRGGASLDELVGQLDLSHRLVRGALEKLVDAGLVAVTGRERERFLPVNEAAGLTPAEVVRRLKPAAELPPGALASPVLVRLESLLDESEQARLERLGRRSFEELLRPPEETRSGS